MIGLIVGIIDGIAKGTSKGFVFAYDKNLTDKERSCLESYFEKLNNNVSMNNAAWEDNATWVMGDDEKNGIPWNGGAGSALVAEMKPGLKHCKISDQKSDVIEIAIYETYGNDWSKIAVKKRQKAGYSKTGMSNATTSGDSSGMAIAIIALAVAFMVMK